MQISELNFFDLTVVSNHYRYSETRQSTKAQRTGSGFEAMDFNKYQSYFMQLGHLIFDDLHI